MRRELEGSVTALRLHYGMAAGSEDLRGQASDLRFVFDQQNGEPLDRGRRRLTPLSGFDWATGFVRGEVDFESRATARLADDANLPFVLNDDRVDRRQAKTRAFAALFGRIEGLEDVREDLVRNAQA